MPYNFSGQLQYGQPVTSFIGARDNATKNALFQQQAADQQATSEANRQNLLFQQQRQTAADQVAAQERSKASSQDEGKQIHAAMQALNAVAGDPVKFQGLSQRILNHPTLGPVLAKHGVTMEDMTPANVQELLSSTGAEIGQASADQFEQVQGPRGSVIKKNTRTGDLAQVVGPDNSQPRSNAFRLLSAQEIATAGLPPGTSAQKDLTTGKVDVISKRDNTGVLSQKDATTAKMKLNTVKLARAQLMKVKEAFDEGRKGINAFGPGQGILPTQAGKKFDGRVDQMRSTLTALTRVPGVGSMSDYETKLDQAKFPSRGAFESVTADKIQGLDDMLSLIENGYTDLLSGNSPQGQASATAKQPTVSNW